LVYRGRGVQFHPEIPVSQFNHMIVHSEIDGKELWYDGTNRTSFPEITTLDVVNQQALVLDTSFSHLENIDEMIGNKLTIEGSFQHRDRDLIGTLEITLSNQYAVEFSFAKSYLNQKDMADYICQWLEKNLQNNIQVNSLRWELDSADFKIFTSCKIPSSIIHIGSSKYIRLGSILNRLIPMDISLMKTNELFYNPYYNHVSINLTIDNLFYFYHTNPAESVTWNLNYDLPIGPFTEIDKTGFISQIKSLKNLFTENIQCK
ncbi:MAG: hypothetical protein PHW79_06570, partial [Candidatus Marinimicrobia bacterium]|nr:hypothetical protein [Candidatus Neomarinimicrobiota bacterium]